MMEMGTYKKVLIEMTFSQCYSCDYHCGQIKVKPINMVYT